MISNEILFRVQKVVSTIKWKVISVIPCVIDVIWDLNNVHGSKNNSFMSLAQLLFAALLAFAVAKPLVYEYPVAAAYTAPVAAAYTAPVAYSAYSYPYAYSAYTYGSPYSYYFR